MTKAQKVNEYLRYATNPTHKEYIATCDKAYIVTPAYFSTLKKSKRNINIDLSLHFKHFNQKYFNKEIDESLVSVDWSPRASVKRLGNTHHKSSTKRTKVTITRSFIDNEEEALKTLIHEMIHVWQFQKFNTADHGESFKRKSASIYSIDHKYKVTRTRNVVLPLKNSNSVQYAIINGNQVNFVRNLKSTEIKRLIDYKVLKNEGPQLNVRHNKNFSAFLTSKYYIRKDLLDLSGFVEV